jgi:outer membrane protein TolC
MKQLIPILGTLFFVFPALSQEQRTIGMAEAVAKVREHNTTVRIAAQEVHATKGTYNESNSLFLPQISISHTAMATTNPLMAFGFKLNQEILTANDFDPALLNDPGNTSNFATRVEIRQPLINLDGLYQRQAAKTAMEASSLQADHTMDQMVLETKRAYMQLQLAHKTLEVMEMVKKSAEENKRLANNRFNQGYLQRADVLAMEVRASEVDNQLQAAKSMVANASNYLSVLMNDTSFPMLRPIDTLSIDPINFDATDISDNRADLKALLLASKGQEQLYKAHKMDFLPKLNAFGSYELYDDRVFQTGASGYLLGASLSWNLLEGGGRLGKIQKGKADLERSKLKYQQYRAESELELNRARRALQDTQNNLSLTLLALQQSGESLRIRTNRFKEGLEKTSDLLQAESQYAHKQLEYYNTIYNHNHALAYLAFLTH